MYNYAISLYNNGETLLLARHKNGSKEGKAIIFCSESNISDLRTVDMSENAFKIFGQIANGEMFDESLVSEIKEENKKNTVKEALNFINEGGFVKPGFTGIGLTDSFIKSYSAIHIGNRIIIPSKFDKVITNTDNNNDILLNYNGHYSSLPIISVNKQRYLFDSAGNLHQDLNQDQSFKVKGEIVGKFPGIQSLSPFGLDYQNDSKACGIWSANILNQVQEFKKTSRESEIVKTYTGSDRKPYKILNPEILLRAAAQVSKDLTPEGQQPEIRILQERQQVEKDYVPLKIGNTTFAIDTNYRPVSCIDIEAIALSIPEKELINDMKVNRDFIKKQSEIFSNYAGTQQETRIDVIKKASNILFSESSRKESLRREDIAGREYVKARLKALNSKQVQNARLESQKIAEKTTYKS